MSQDRRRRRPAAAGCQHTSRTPSAGEDSGRGYWEHASSGGHPRLSAGPGRTKTGLRRDLRAPARPGGGPLQDRWLCLPRGSHTRGLRLRPRAGPVRHVQPRPGSAQPSRCRAGSGLTLLGDTEYDLVLRTVPGPHGVGATVKLVNRSTFLKDLTTLGLELEDRVRRRGGDSLGARASPRDLARLQRIRHDVLLDHERRRRRTARTSCRSRPRCTG